MTFTEVKNGHFRIVSKKVGTRLDGNRARHYFKYLWFKSSRNLEAFGNLCRKGFGSKMATRSEL
jgi:hypothetical protein